jgi:senataxin
MDEVQAELLKWYEKFKELPPEAHLLCPRLSNDDDEDYKVLDDPDSLISIEEKKKRITEGQKRLEITYWNTLVFGFDKRDSGEWLDQFTDRLNGCLRECADCVLNWHMQRKPHLRKFAE